jgi:hypothetical protein
MSRKTSYFITCHVGSPKYTDAARRLTAQAERLQLFDVIHPWCEDELKDTQEFWERHCDFIEKNPRGYGYWIWKPYIIKKTMEEALDGDSVLYLDSGCELLLEKRAMLAADMESAEKLLILGQPTQVEAEYTKADLLAEMGISHPYHLFSPQLQAGAILFHVCPTTRSLVHDWYELASDYKNIDDSPSTLPNFPFFSEHRHDQSVFSLLVKEYGLFRPDVPLRSVEYIRNVSKDSLFYST